MMSKTHTGSKRDDDFRDVSQKKLTLMCLRRVTLTTDLPLPAMGVY